MANGRPSPRRASDAFLRKAQQRPEKAEEWETRLRRADRRRFEADHTRLGIAWPDYWHYVVLRLFEEGRLK